MKKFSAWKVLIVVLMLLLPIPIAFVGIKLSEQTDWYFDNERHVWRSPQFKKLPPCPSPLLSISPVDTQLATGVLYPGQYRGTDYKPHGGIGFAQNAVEVKLPLDAYLVFGSRYTENGDLQYILDFQNDCGIRFRFDHLLTLSPTFQEIANTLPEPKPSDSRGVPLKSALFPAGTVVATAVGLPSMQNSGMDFGLYDLRLQNKISQNDYWRSLHADELEHAAYGVCWLTMLPEKDVEHIKKLEAQYGTDYPLEKAVSDYCTAPAGTTLDQHNGYAPPEGY